MCMLPLSVRSMSVFACPCWGSVESLDLRALQSVSNWIEAWKVELVKESS